MRTSSLLVACLVFGDAACSRSSADAIPPLSAIELAIKEAKPNLRGMAIRAVYLGENYPISLGEALRKLEMPRSTVPELRELSDDLRVWYVVLRQGTGVPGADVVVLLDAGSGKRVLFRFIG